MRYHSSITWLRTIVRSLFLALSPFSFKTCHPYVYVQREHLFAYVCCIGKHEQVVLLK